MDSLKSIAFCDLEFGLYSKLNYQMKDYELSRSRSMFAQSVLNRFRMFVLIICLGIRSAFTRPLVLWLNYILYCLCVFSVVFFFRVYTKALAD